MKKMKYRTFFDKLLEDIRTYSPFHDYSYYDYFVLKFKDTKTYADIKYAPLFFIFGDVINIRLLKQLVEEYKYRKIYK